MTGGPVAVPPIAGVGARDPMSPRRLAGVLLVAGAVLANAAFVGLGSVFEYPDVLQQPAPEVLAAFSADEGMIVGFFCLLALGAALLAPGALLVGRLIGGPLGTWSARVGIAAAAVQVVGLLRWPLVVPSLADRATDRSASTDARADAADTFELVSGILGTGIGETLGYLLTALWTVLIVQAFRGQTAGWWFSALGVASAALILSGIAIPLDLPGADFANFAGYILWSVWLIVFAALLWRRPPRRRGTSLDRAASVQPNDRLTRLSRFRDAHAAGSGVSQGGAGLITSVGGKDIWRLAPSLALPGPRNLGAPR